MGKETSPDARGSINGQFCRLCGAWRGSYGLEPTLDCLGWATGQPCGQCYVCHTVQIFREVRRVLRKDGTLWLNLGDSYAGSWGNYGAREGKQRAKATERYDRPAYEGANGYKSLPPTVHGSGLKPKDLCGVPWRVALALQVDGWWLRSDIIWAKPNPMPESCTDRPTTAHEHIFLLTKSGDITFWTHPTKPGQRTKPKPDYVIIDGKRRNLWRGHDYFYDAEAVREETQASEASQKRAEYGRYELTDGKAKRNNRAGKPDFLQAKGNDYGGGGRNLRSVWTIATAPFPEAHFACVDAETEALTPFGWKTHDQLSNGDLIAGYDQESHVLSWQSAEFWAYQVNCELVVIEKRDSSQRLTENHRCLVRRRIGGEAVVLAADLKPGMEIPIAAPLLVTETEGPGEDFAALFGWYLTEGELKRHHIIRINQSLSANPEKVDRIRELLKNLNADFSERIREREYRGRPSIENIFSVKGEVAERLHRESPDKKIDLSWINWPLPDIRALLNAMIDGDGHRRKDGRSCIVQKDRGFLDAAQMLALRLGLRTIISPRKEGGFTLYITEGDWLTLRGTNGVHAPVGREHYKGIIWCPSVESTFWIARRKGRTFITGNTFPPAIPERCIKAGTSEKGCCPRCLAPWRRVVEKSGGRDWHNDKMKSKGIPGELQGEGGYKRGQSMSPMNDTQQATTTGWVPTCTCNAGEPIPCTILDPFAGAGTTGVVAAKLGREAVLIELNPEYCRMATTRLKKELGMLAEIDMRQCSMIEIMGE